MKTLFTENVFSTLYIYIYKYKNKLDLYFVTWQHMNNL